MPDADRHDAVDDTNAPAPPGQDAEAAARASYASPRGGTGRVYMPDPRDRLFSVRDRLPRSALSARNWKTKVWPRIPGTHTGTQWDTSDCVYFMCAHLHIYTPVVRPDALALLKPLYPWAQDNDEWPGSETAPPTYAGTSVRAGLQYCRKEAGTVTRFDWCPDMDAAIGRLTAPKDQGGGPLGTGSDWWTAMDNLSGHAYEDNWWEPGGWYRGGHAWVIEGYVRGIPGRREGYFVTVNSHEGNKHGKMRESVAEYLFFQANGELAAVTEAPTPPRVRRPARTKAGAA